MNKSKSIFKGVIRSAVLVLILLGMANCSQFTSFSGSEFDAHLSKNPVFDSPVNSYAGPDNTDIGIVSNDGPDNPDGPNNPGNPTTPPVTPSEPFVVVDTPTPLPPFQFCPDGQFQVLERDGTYSACRPCVAQGTRMVNGVQVPICEVQRCDGTNQYIFFGNNVDEPSRTCERCDVLSNDQTSCVVTVEPPVVLPPPPPVVDIPAPPVNPPVRNCTTHPQMRRCRPTVSGGDGGGDGGGDPLMIDSEGESYASEAELMDDDYTYFKRGTFRLTNPAPIAGVPQDVDDLEQRQNFEGFNLLGKQDQTVLDNGDFLHIHTAGRDFKFQKISWTRMDQDRYRFLALPDSNGYIQGIDQLFGDNTFGPDAHRPFANDGFEALMKYDRGDADSPGEFISDGYIDANDAVFSRLRLWHDYNGDGNVDNAAEAQNELKPLDHFEISYIHLIPNEKFYETDKYGNDIAYKSIVGFRAPTGGYKLGTAFDLWFQYNPREVISTGNASVVPQ